LAQGIKMPVVRIEVSHQSEIGRLYRQGPFLELSCVFSFCHIIR
jgi:hypothetical protein